MSTNENGNKSNERIDPTKGKMIPGDLPDNEHDESRMQSEAFIIDLPDVKDIPGQEFIHPPIMESFADVTISSDDEEGVGIFEEDTEEDDPDSEIIMGTDADVEEDEKLVLDKADKELPTQDAANLTMVTLDSTDNEGDLLNEGGAATDVSGADLDTGLINEDDAMENIGAEDEENNTYSLGTDNNDNVTEGTP